MSVRVCASERVLRREERFFMEGERIALFFLRSKGGGYEQQSSSEH